MYGTGQSNVEYIQTLYTEILGKEPDAEGLSYWESQLDNGIDGRDAVLNAFAGAAGYDGIDALDTSQCAIIMTHWKEYDGLNDALLRKMKRKFIIDCRRVLVNKKLDV